MGAVRFRAMPIQFFEYKTCSTCQKAVKFLTAKKVEFERIPIVDSPPSPRDLEKMLKILKERSLGLKNLFNTSGVQYRELAIAEKLKKGLSDNEAFKLLAGNGKLIKRPFLLTGRSGTVGFDEKLWSELLKGE